MKRRSFLLSLLAPILAFFGIGKDRIPGAMGIFCKSAGVTEAELRVQNWTLVLGLSVDRHPDVLRPPTGGSPDN